MMRRLVIINALWVLATCDAHHGDPAARDLSASARTALREGRWREAVATLEVAARDHARAGRISNAVLDHQARAYTLIYSGLELEAAAHALDQADALIEPFGESHATQPYYRGLLLLESGDHRGAIAALRLAQDRLTKLNMTALVRAAAEAEVAALATLGARHEAMARLTLMTTPTPSEDACSAARTINNTAWLRLIDADSKNEAPPSELVDALEDTVQTFETTACHRPRASGTARVHLALAQLLTHDPNSAIETLSAKADDAGPDVAYWRAEVLGRAYLANGDLEAADRELDDAVAIAHRSSMTDAEWRARTYQGDVRVAWGDPTAAADRFRDAEALLDRRSLDVPLGSHRSSFLVDRQRSARRWASLLIDAGQEERAACVLRRSNQRLMARAERSGRLAQLDGTTRADWDRLIGSYRRIRRDVEAEQAADWDMSAEERAPRIAARGEQTRRAEEALTAALRLIERDGDDASSYRPSLDPCDGLARPTEQQMMVLIERIDGNEHVAIAVDTNGAQAHRVHATSDNLASRIESLLNGPLNKRIQRASTVIVLSHGLDIHTMRWRGRPLAASTAVVYSMDLGKTPPAVRASDRALVIGDPTRNLRGSAREANLIAGRLDTMGFAVEQRRGKNSDARSVREGLTSASLLHFAGHGNASGTGLFDDHLELADGRLTVADVLASGAVPSRVVLSGCRTGSVGSATLNLATAFVLAGSTSVVASTRDITDQEGFDFSQTIYAQGGASNEARDLNLVAAYQRAARDGVPGWDAFRVWVR